MCESSMFLFHHGAFKRWSHYVGKEAQEGLGSGGKKCKKTRGERDTNAELSPRCPGVRGYFPVSVRRCTADLPQKGVLSSTAFESILSTSETGRLTQ